MQHLASILAVAALAATVSAQTTILPQSASTIGGSTANAFPWGTTATGWPGLRILCVYDSSHFTNAPIPINYPILITSVSWRANDVTGSWTGGTYTLGAQVRLATAAVDYTAATTNWAANLGPDVTTVHNGPVTVLAGTGNGVGVPGPLVVTIPVSPPFLYIPGNGDLCVDTDYTSAGNFVGGTLPGMDVHGINVLGSRVYGSSLYPGANGVDAACPVIQIGYVPASGYAQAAPYGTGCISSPDISSYEFFSTAAAFDLNNTAITLLPTGTGYTAIPGITTYVPPSGSATVLPLTDDSETTVALSSPMLFGSGVTSQLTVCSNGFISPGTGNGTSFTPAAAAFLNSTRAWLSLAWHDFNPSIAGSGTVKFEEVGGTAYVTWDGVWDFGGTSAANANRFQAQFHLASGLVHVVYQTMSGLGSTILVGFSDAGPSPDPGSMDISAALPGTFTAAQWPILPLTHTVSARPVIGTSISLLSTSVPPSALVGVQVLGLTEFTAGIDLTFLGMPGCRLYSSLDATATFAVGGGTGSSPLVIPANPSLAGAVVLSQSTALVPGINPFGFLSSNGIRLTLDLN